jgi:hypothetical protein
VQNELLRHVRPLVLEKEQEEYSDLVEKANSFLDGFSWADGRKGLWIAECIPGIIGIFLVELDPSGQNIDQFTWVVVGDLPPAYLSSAYAKSPWDALDGYMGEMKAWVDAVENGQPTHELIPVNGAPTLANAQALRSRLEFLGREILPHLRGNPEETANQ